MNEVEGCQITYLSFNFVRISQVNEIQVISIWDVLSTIGGLYTAIVKVILLIVSPFLYWSFNNAMKQSIHQKQTTEAPLQIQDIRHRVSFEGVFKLHQQAARHKLELQSIREDHLETQRLINSRFLYFQ